MADKHIAVNCISYGGAEALSISKKNLEFSLKPNEVLIKVAFAGLNFPDTLTVKGQDQYGLGLPFIPGREVSGVVLEIGKDVKNLTKGDRVMADMLSGALQSHTTVHKSKVHKIPNELSLEDASVFSITYGTAYHALVQRGEIETGMTIAVLGAAGGVGTALIQLAKIWDCKVVACVSSKEKQEYCKSIGADITVNYNKSDLKADLKSITAPNNGVDLICDMVGGTYSESAFRAIKWGGKHLIIGFANGSIPKIPLNLPLLKGASLTGVFWSTFVSKSPLSYRKNTEELLKLWGERKFPIQIQRIYPYTEVASAFNDISERKVLGKISVSF